MGIHKQVTLKKRFLTERQKIDLEDAITRLHIKEQSQDPNKIVDSKYSYYDYIKIRSLQKI